MKLRIIRDIRYLISYKKSYYSYNYKNQKKWAAQLKKICNQNHLSMIVFRNLILMIKLT